VRLLLILLIAVGFAPTDAIAQRPGRVTIPANRPARLDAEFHRAETAWKSGHSLLEARARIDRVLKELPGDADALKLRAGIFMSMDNIAPALEDARRAATLQPSDAEAHLLVCEAASRMGSRAEASQALTRSAELLLDENALRETNSFYVRLSRCAEELERYDAAEAYARTALAGDRRNADAYLQLARVFVLQNSSDKALTVLRQGADAGLLNGALLRADRLLVPLADSLNTPR